MTDKLKRFISDFSRRKEEPWNHLIVIAMKVCKVLLCYGSIRYLVTNRQELPRPLPHSSQSAFPSSYQLIYTIISHHRIFTDAFRQIQPNHAFFPFPDLIQQHKDNIVVTSRLSQLTIISTNPFLFLTNICRLPINEKSKLSILRIPQSQSLAFRRPFNLIEANS